MAMGTAAVVRFAMAVVVAVVKKRQKWGKSWWQRRTTLRLAVKNAGTVDVIEVSTPTACRTACRGGAILAGAVGLQSSSAGAVACAAAARRDDAKLVGRARHGGRASGAAGAQRASFGAGRSVGNIEVITRTGRGGAILAGAVGLQSSSAGTAACAAAARRDEAKLVVRARHGGRADSLQSSSADCAAPDSNQGRLEIGRYLPVGAGGTIVEAVVGLNLTAHMVASSHVGRGDDSRP